MNPEPGTLAKLRHRALAQEPRGDCRAIARVLAGGSLVQPAAIEDVRRDPGEDQRLRRDQFKESGLIAVVIEASLASLQGERHPVALRKTRESERSEYAVLEIYGDATVTQEVIAP